MAWDDTKGPGDGLPSKEWNNHVDDQKSNNGNIVQSTEPPVGDPGDMWSQTSLTGNVVNVYDTNGVGLPSGDSENGYIYSTSNGEVTREEIFGTGSTTGTVGGIDSTTYNVAVNSGTMYIGGDGDSTTDYAGVTARVNSDMTTQWTVATDSYDTFAVYATGSAVYSGGDKNLSALNPSDGSSMWTHTHHSVDINNIYHANGVVYSDGSQLVAADDSDGSLLWENSVPAESDMVLHNGTLYTSGSEVSAVDPSNGSVLWTFSSGSENNGLGVVNGELLVADASGVVSALDLNDGSLVWDLDTGGSYSYNIYTDSNGTYALGDRSVDWEVVDEVDLHVSNGDYWMWTK